MSELKPIQTPELPQMPYRGLNAFRYADHTIFSERNEESLKLLSLIRIYRGSLLYGQSGTGKSSLIAAGLIPLTKNHYAPEVIRVFPKAETAFIVTRIKATEKENDYLPSLFDSFIVEKKAEKIYVPFTDFKEKILAQRIRSSGDTEASAKCTFLIFDQFEELITLFHKKDPAEKEVAEKLQHEIIEFLQTCYYDPGLNVKLLFAFREDYLPEFSKLFELLPDLNDHYLRLTAVKKGKLENIIGYPFKQDTSGRHFNPHFSATFIETLAARFEEHFKDGVILTEVQIVSLYLYNIKDEDERNALLEGKDPIKRVLEKFYLKILDEFSADEKETAIVILSVLVLNERTRNIYPYEKIVEEYLEETGTEAYSANVKVCEMVLGKLVDESRIIRKESRDDGEYYEIRSEAIIPFIVTKKIEREKEKELEEARREEELKLKESRKELERKIQEGKRRSRLVVAGVLLFSVFLFGAIYLYYKNNETQFAKQELEQNEARIKLAQDSLEQKKARIKLDQDALAQKEQLDSLEDWKRRDEADRQKKLNEIEHQKKLAEIEQRRIEAEFNLMLQRKEKEYDLEIEKKRAEADVRSKIAGFIARVSLSLPSYEQKEKCSLARLAYDTLDGSTAGSKRFDPEIYTALADALGEKALVKKYGTYSIARGYANVESVLAGKNDYFVSCPFNGVNNSSGTSVLNDTNLVRSWINAGNTLFAVLDMKPKFKTKRLVIKSYPKDSTLAMQDIVVEEEVVSLVFAPDNKTCLYSTKTNAKKGKVYELNLASKSQVMLYECETPGEYAFVLNTGSGITGITNLGKYIERNGIGFNRQKQLDIKEEIVTSVCYNTLTSTLFAGTEDGSVSQWENSGAPELLSSQGESSKINVIACSPDGQWLAAGYVNGRVSVWKLDSIQAAPAVLVKDNSKSYGAENNSITGLCFSKVQKGINSLVIATRSGNVYAYPASMDAMAAKIDDRNMFITDKGEWDKSAIPKSIKYKKISPAKIK
jgi:hypothetical protein